METKQVNNYKIEFYSEEEWNMMPYFKHEEYAGKVLDINEELAEKIVDKKFGETRINNKNIFTYKDYSGIVSKYYPFTLEGELSEKTLQQCWENGGKLTTSFFHSTAKESFQTLSDLEYCIITKIE